MKFTKLNKIEESMFERMIWIGGRPSSIHGSEAYEANEKNEAPKEVADKGLEGEISSVRKELNSNLDSLKIISKNLSQVSDLSWQARRNISSFTERLDSKIGDIENELEKEDPNTDELIVEVDLLIDQSKEYEKYMNSDEKIAYAWEDTSKVDANIEDPIRLSWEDTSEVDGRGEEVGDESEEEKADSKEEGDIDSSEEELSSKEKEFEEDLNEFEKSLKSLIRIETRLGLETYDVRYIDNAKTYYKNEKNKDIGVASIRLKDELNEVTQRLQYRKLTESANKYYGGKDFEGVEDWDSFVAKYEKEKNNTRKLRMVKDMQKKMNEKIASENTEEDNESQSLTADLNLKIKDGKVNFMLARKKRGYKFEQNSQLANLDKKNITKNQLISVLEGLLEAEDFSTTPEYRESNKALVEKLAELNPEKANEYKSKMNEYYAGMYEISNSPTASASSVEQSTDGSVNMTEETLTEEELAIEEKGAKIEEYREYATVETIKAIIKKGPFKKHLERANDEQKKELEKIIEKLSREIYTDYLEYLDTQKRILHSPPMFGVDPLGHLKSISEYMKASYGKKIRREKNKYAKKLSKEKEKASKDDEAPSTVKADTEKVDKDSTDKETEETSEEIVLQDTTIENPSTSQELPESVVKRFERSEDIKKITKRFDIVTLDASHDEELKGIYGFGFYQNGFIVRKKGTENLRGSYFFDTENIRVTENDDGSLDIFETYSDGSVLRNHIFKEGGVYWVIKYKDGKEQGDKILMFGKEE